ncbi:DUF3857 domain-containing protein [Mucilaginibacter agri]|uniref:DUF3857 domain-containing protein n=1 Tax=Mucilaginibacter agri TaxID=2695265 RepID=A0A965ZEG7_9SPHI|nr:DUF3857 domain-containing protein [Mucilaginibacter agri]NCD69230.1 DUF3857 domain-containing protein [Mucilaginibacter agri]
MKLFTPLLAIGCAVLQLSATAQVVKPTQPYGKIDKADLELKTCSFEPDANAMVLFEKGDLYFDQDFNIVLEYHKRVKIFNENGKDQANVKIDYYGGNHYENVTNIQAETINLEGDKVEITKVDKKQIFNQIIDKAENQYTFSFPNVKAGSVIEYKYVRTVTGSYNGIPDWFFQAHIPVKYSELDTAIPDIFTFKTQIHTVQPWVKDKPSSSSGTLGTGTNALTFTVVKNERALENIPSLPDEPYMTSDNDNLQSIYFQLVNITAPAGGFIKNYADTWPKVGEALADNDDFGGQLKRKLTNEEPIIAKAKTLKTQDEKISYIFNEVKNTLKWNNVDRWYTNEGTRSAWDKKSGNSTEINIILYHLLKQAGVDVYPMVVSTRAHGKVNPAFPFTYQFNRTVAYVPIDSTTHYVLDATSKYNVYNETPDNLLNSFGFCINKEKAAYDLVFLEKAKPSYRSVYIQAEITPDGQMSGTASINSSSYSRIKAVRDYKTDGEKKYMESLTDHDNNLKISSLKMDGLEIDSIPLTQNIDFKLDLTGSDGTYIYFAPNIFTSLHTNPFLSENRHSDIDFGYRNNCSVTGMYKIPAGYKADALPKSVSMVMPDKSISIKRIIVEQDGMIRVSYQLAYAKTVFFKEDYDQLHEFYKKMQELLNEQIVLKKS